MAPSSEEVAKNGTYEAPNVVNGVHTNGLYDTNRSNSSSSHDIPLNDNYAFTPRKLRVVTIGAGFSGLLIAHKFQHRFPEMQEYVEHTIFERNNNLGGTWLVNTYPGVQCDVPSHIYVSKASKGFLINSVD